MKCLHKLRSRRYPSVFDLQADMRLYLEGRSVSAAPDTFAQAAWKLVRRNGRVSASIAAAAVVLVAVTTFFLIRLKGERDDAVEARRAAEAAREQAQCARDEQRRIALAASKRFAGQAAQAAQRARWDEANEYAGNAEAVCPDGPWALYARGRFAQVRNQHEAAVGILQRARDTEGADESVSAALRESLAFLDQLAAARRLANEDTSTRDYQALESLAEAMMAAERWPEAAEAFRHALSAAERATAIPVPDREQISDRIAHRLGEAKAWVACDGFAKSLGGVPAAEQIKAVEAKLTEIHGQPIRFHETKIVDGCWVSAELRSQPRSLAYLAPLRGLKLSRLRITSQDVRDLAPLRGMPLTHLKCQGRKIRDLSPIRGMALVELQCHQTAASDLTPAKGMPLQTLSCNETEIEDLSPLTGAPIAYLYVHGTRVRNLGPLQGMPLRILCCHETRVTDLTPLRGMQLEIAIVPVRQITKGMNVLRDMSSLKHIGDSWFRQLAPQEFWRRYDAGEFGK
jgi:tetratricopeptide (TPR) repeat protein